MAVYRAAKSAKLLRKDAKQDEVCEKCKDARKDKPILGMQIIRGAKKKLRAKMCGKAAKFLTQKTAKILPAIDP